MNFVKGFGIKWYFHQNIAEIVKILWKALIKNVWQNIAEKVQILSERRISSNYCSKSTDFPKRFIKKANFANRLHKKCHFYPHFLLRITPELFLLVTFIETWCLCKSCLLKQIDLQTDVLIWLDTCIYSCFVMNTFLVKMQNFGKWCLFLPHNYSTFL